MTRLFAVLLLVTAWLDAHAQSSLPPCPTDTSVVRTNCFGTYTFPSGEKYVGEFKDDERNGRGTNTFPSGAKYVGEYKDGKYNGQGTFTWPSGAKYVGEYKDDKRNGQGTYTYPNGAKYVGEYEDDERNGQGTYTSPNGEKYVGEWKDDKRNGQGTFTWPDGRKFVGEYKDDERNGQGIQYNPNGSVKESGMWRDDQLSQPFAIDTTRFPFGAGASPDVKDPTTRESNKKTSVEIVNGCLAKRLKPGTPQFSACVAGQ